MTETVRVDLGARSYDIHVGAGLLEGAARLAKGVVRERRVFVVTDDRVAPLHADRIESGFRAEGIEPLRQARAIVLPEYGDTVQMGAICRGRRGRAARHAGGGQRDRCIRQHHRGHGEGGQRMPDVSCSTHARLDELTHCA